MKSRDRDAPIAILYIICIRIRMCMSVSKLIIPMAYGHYLTFDPTSDIHDRYELQKKANEYTFVVKATQSNFNGRCEL